MLKKSMLAMVLATALLGQVVWAGQDTPENPLLGSWERYLELKGSSEFGLEWVSVGPVMNGARAACVQGDPSRPGTLYAAFGPGNLWKTTDNGLTWRPIFENQPAPGIGDVALAPSRPETIWLGTGVDLKKPRNFTMPGTGVFRSDDGGATWRSLGLRDSYHIGKIDVHPTNPDIAFVAVHGHYWTTNPNRGLYRTLDGGVTWEHVLFVSERTGANDVVIAPSDPSVVYATTWENYPGVSGPSSGVWKSEDAGKTWRRLGGGLPAGPKTGRIGVAVSASDPAKAYVLVDNLNKDETRAAEVYKTTDGGATWSRTHTDDLLIFPRIGWYFADIYLNPKDDEEVYALGVRIAHSRDGGRTFGLLGGDVYHLFPSPAQTLHLDHCELWIDPGNPDHLAVGNDGGVYTSFDRGKTWIHHNNIPVGEFYDVSVDNQEPYMIYGGTQDDASVFGPAREWDPRYADGWRYVWLDAWSGGDGCYTFADPEDPTTVYFSSQNGAARRKDMRTGRSVSIMPRLPKGFPGRAEYNFITPYFISPHNRLTLYHAGNYVFKSSDRGDSWKLISPDLARSADPGRLSTAAGAIAESPLDPGVLFLGTDRGAFWVTLDDGGTWVERSAGLPANYIRSICPSRFSRTRVYVAAPGINQDDLGCRLFASEDRGLTWTPISAGLPDEVAYAIVEDPTNENILYAGLLRGVYVSVDRGRTWALLGPGLPAAAVSDLVIQEREMDLVASTYGRGIYVMNIRPIQEIFKKGAAAADRLLDPPAARRPWTNDTHRDPSLSTVEKVPLTFYLTGPKDVTLSVHDAKGREVKAWRLSGKKGFNQLRWDLVVKTADSPEPYFVRYREFAPAGDYEIRLTGDGLDLRRPLKVEERTSQDD
ncbi:MAG: hypothetical protein MUQ25_15660 [Candidatus Aminicenantes bacterium]|nr:hypothetical protein [Candidatus Aminicenantes bacterium]